MGLLDCAVSSLARTLPAGGLLGVAFTVLVACGGIAIDERPELSGNSPGQTGGNWGSPPPGDDPPPTGSGGTMSSGSNAAGSGGTTADGSGGVSGVGGQPESDDGFLTPEQAAMFCELTCAPRLDDVCATTYVCNDRACDGPATQWNQVEREAFAACVQVENLCFFNLDACLFDETHPASVHPRTLRVHLEHTEHLASTVVYVRGKSHQNHGIHQAELAADTSSLEWSGLVEHYPWGGIYAWFDVDSDGICDPETDEFAWAMPTSNQDPESIVYSALLSPALSQPQDPCSMF